MAINDLPQEAVSKAVSEVGTDPNRLTAAEALAIRPGLFGLAVVEAGKALKASGGNRLVDELELGYIIRTVAHSAVLSTLAALARAEELAAEAAAATTTPNPETTPTLFDEV